MEILSLPARSGRDRHGVLSFILAYIRDIFLIFLVSGAAEYASAAAGPKNVLRGFSNGI
jgi:hypothetical protein